MAGGKTGLAARGIDGLGGSGVLEEDAERGVADSLGLIPASGNRGNPEMKKRPDDYGRDGAEGDDQYYLHDQKGQTVAAASMAGRASPPRSPR